MGNEQFCQIISVGVQLNFFAVTIIFYEETIVEFCIREATKLKSLISKLVWPLKASGFCIIQPIVKIRTCPWSADVSSLWNKNVSRD